MSSALSATPAISANPWLAPAVRIEGITAESPGVATYHLRFVDPEVERAYRFRAGQFNMLYLPGVGEIAIGVSSGSAEHCPLDAAGEIGRDEIGMRGSWDHTVRQAGVVTTALARLGVGGALCLRGPYGKPWPIDAGYGKDVLLVAGGSGLASLRCAIYQLIAQRHRFRSIRLLYGSRTPESLLYTREYSAWLAAGLEVETTVDRADGSWRGSVGVVTQLLARLRPWDPGQTVMWACGPEVMMRFVVRAAAARGLAKDHVWASMERHMQCAVGLCGHCQFGPEMICKSGPVYRYDEIEPYLNVEGL